MPRNTAAWLDEPYADLVVRQAPYRAPGRHEIVLRNRAVAVNPLDHVKQGTGALSYRWLPYPSILGEDVAGEVAEVGEDVTRFRVGDRVVAYAVGMEKGRDHRAEGGFQTYTVVRDSLAAPIPDSLAFEDAVVLPLGISTAASALFQTDQLNLRHPTGDAPPSDEVVVVWGASTSVGSNAVQLAVAAGYEVIATASPRNSARALQLGATAVFDYSSPTVVQEIAAAVRGRPVVGVLAVGTGSAEPAVAVAVATGSKRVTMASPSVSFGDLPRRRGPSLIAIRILGALVAGNIALQLRSRARGIRARFVWGSTLMDNEVGPMLWQDFLPAALDEGRYVPAPQAEVIGRGLDQVQVALDRLKAGVSARKLVVLV